MFGGIDSAVCCGFAAMGINVQGMNPDGGMVQAPLVLSGRDEVNKGRKELCCSLMTMNSNIFRMRDHQAH